MGLIFLGCQPSFFTKSSNCVHGLCRDGMCSDTSELEVDLYLLKSILKGLQVHRCTQSFKYFWDSISIYNYYKHKHMLPKLCMNKCKIYENLAEYSQALDRRKTTHPNSRNSTAAVAVLSNLHLYHFNGKFHQFVLHLPKPAVLNTSQKLCRLCCYSSKTTATLYSNYFILKH